MTQGDSDKPPLKRYLVSLGMNSREVFAANSFDAARRCGIDTTGNTSAAQVTELPDPPPLYELLKRIESLEVSVAEIRGWHVLDWWRQKNLKP
jgi:hypothetical protein